VLAHPGYFYDFGREAFFAFSLLPAPELFREAMRALSQIFRSI
jgi:hypothetical protein